MSCYVFLDINAKMLQTYADTSYINVNGFICIYILSYSLTKLSNKSTTKTIHNLIGARYEKGEMQTVTLLSEDKGTASIKNSDKVVK